MMTFYAAAGSYQIRNEDGKDMPYIMRLGKLQPVSIPEFSIWSMLLWDVLTHDELRKKYFEKMEEVKLDPSGFEKALEMLVKRKLIIKGVGYTGADALYNMLYDKLLILSAGIAIAGGVKVCSFYLQVSKQQYECLEGLLVQEQVNIHRKRHAIVLELENGSHVQRVLDGRYKLKAGSLYRFYLKKPTNDLPNLPEALQPSSTVFGFEELSFSTSKQI